ncbi:unnamed protein product [Clonostachys rosea]|uniref:Phosphoribulokinase/uridine kinase domain-containing protein n=1 Tax=Bionectria ochroleuca TaxID=29856 RepID=A0ABY6UMW1_BIOOC|nr:unnamed protein product [Clonostachys rosea]
MERVIDALTTRASSLQASIETNRALESGSSRAIIILAGAPGSGKSTIAKEVVRRLNVNHQIQTAFVLPMDGFHYSMAELNAMPNAEEAIARRGAPWTFDAEGVVALFRQLRETAKLPPSDVPDILAPSFDHAIKNPVKNDIRIGAHVSLVIIEGNWLLYDEKPWRQIRNLVDEAWYVDVDLDVARRRVAKRHIESGIMHDWDMALSRVDSNDMINANLVRDRLIEPDLPS